MPYPYDEETDYGAPLTPVEFPPEFYGLQSPEAPSAEDLDQFSYQPAPLSTRQRLLESLAGLESIQAPPPRGFGEGLLSGFARGLGGAGARAAAERQRIEGIIEKRRVEQNLLNREATRAQRAEERQIGRETRAEERATTKYDLEHPLVTPEMAKQYPELSRLVGRPIPSTELVKLGIERTKAETEAAPALSPAGLDAAAVNWARTGQMVAAGMGKQGVAFRTKIINRAAEIFPNLDLASNRAGFESDKSALTNLKKIHEASSAFERTALKNADVLRGTISRIADTGSPWLNRPVRLIKRGIGDPNLAAFRTALETVAPEFARLLNSPTASGQLSDTAREEIRVILDPNATPRMLLASLGILEQDARNRTSSYAAQIKDIEFRIAHPAAEPGTPESRQSPATDADRAYIQSLRIKR